MAIIEKLPADDIFDIIIPSSKLENDPTDPSIFPENFLSYMTARCQGNPEQYVRNVQFVPGLARISATEENKKLRTFIESFVENWVSCINDIDSRFKGHILPSGSVYEGTKVELPYEYDYMVVLEKFRQILEAKYSEDSVFDDVKMKLKEDLKMNNEVEELIAFSQNGFLMSDKVVGEFMKKFLEKH